MSATVFLTAMAVIALLLLVVLLSEKFERKKEALKLPSGRKIVSEEELFRMGRGELYKLSEEDLSWLINYSGHKIDNNCKNRDKWSYLFREASAVRYGY